MVALAFGPCMFVAPLLVVLIPVAIVLWPPVLIVLGVLYLVVWPFAAIARSMNVQWLPAFHVKMRDWFIVLLRPWKYFEMPAKKP